MQMQNQTVGVRLSVEHRQKIKEQAAFLSVTESSYIRVLINIGIREIERNPAILVAK
jgi:predicted DNA-binding protein